ncbi:hypothetical protein [Saccharopolyspora shandongensis]|uniref:hypothetical protein n=1 Tax=Saccharopolyspora shandongensis TaxID=418495 RepID=UPI0033CA4C54
MTQPTTPVPARTPVTGLLRNANARNNLSAEGASTLARFPPRLGAAPPKPMKAAVAVMALVVSQNQCPVSNSTATCRRSSAECSETRLPASHRRGTGLCHSRTRLAAASTVTAPIGREEVGGPVIRKNSTAPASDRGSWKTFGSGSS